MITSFRMYDAGPRAAAAWRALFAQVFADAGTDIEMIEHGWPQPIDELWGRSELCCAFMCGWPFARSTSGMQAIAAPVPSPPRYEGLPRYCSDFVVREASGWRSLEESFGSRFGWMAENSNSGFNAPRAHLAPFAARRGGKLFAECVGPLGTPMRTLEALREEAVDVVALDGFWLDLLRHHEPGRVAGVRIVASTAWMPIPLLVAAPRVDPAIVAHLRALLARVHEVPRYVPLLAGALLRRFAVPELDAYPGLQEMERAAIEARYARIR